MRMLTITILYYKIASTSEGRVKLRKEIEENNSKVNK
jgi:hypothetical protein